jgi:hypothetical protein
MNNISPEAEHPPITPPSTDDVPHATVSWLVGADAKTERTEPAGATLLDEDIYLGAPVRTAHRYPRQRNYIGYYYFSRTGAHVWHESLLEASTLRWLDFRDDIVAIAAQPMIMTFDDDSWHVPDYMALHSDGRQVVYDVKPSSLINEKVALQFAKTRRLCAGVGWGYEVCTELPAQTTRNVKWLSNFKHPGYSPTREGAATLLAALEAPISVRKAVSHLGAPSIAHARSGIYHLAWSGILALDLNTHINDNTLIERGRHARA